LLVPKSWVDKVLVYKLLLLIISLANELRQVLRKEKDYLKLTIEDEINIAGKEI
jgi:hypothetical protein